MKTETTHQLSLIPEANKVMIDDIILLGKDWRKGVFHRVYVTAKFPETISTNARDVDLGYYILCSPQDDVEMDEEIHYNEFGWEIQDLLKENMVAIIGALRGIA